MFTVHLPSTAAGPPRQLWKETQRVRTERCAVAVAARPLRVPSPSHDRVPSPFKQATRGRTVSFFLGDRLLSGGLGRQREGADKPGHDSIRAVRW